MAEITTISTLEQRLDVLRAFCERAAHRSCTVEPAVYDQYRKQRGKLFGHCGVVAWAVQVQFGGTLMQGNYPDDDVWDAHCWNRLPSGDIDLTSGQFGGDGLHLVTAGLIEVRPLDRREYWRLQDQETTEIFMYRLSRVLRVVGKG